MILLELKELHYTEVLFWKIFWNMKNSHQNTEQDFRGVLFFPLFCGLFPLTLPLPITSWTEAHLISSVLPCLWCPFPVSFLLELISRFQLLNWMNYTFKHLPLCLFCFIYFNLLGLLRLFREHGRIMWHKAKVLKIYTENSNELIYNKKEPFY